MFKGINILIILIIIFMFSTQTRANGILKLDQAYTLVLNQNPQVQSYRAKVEAAEGNRIQQSLMPNPEALFEVEDFGGDDPRNGFNSTEYTVGVEQRIEIAGKRTKREKVASLEKQQVTQDALAGIQATLARTKLAYMNVAIAQDRLSLANKRLDLANKTHTTVKRRVNAAKSADIQHTKTDLEVSMAKVMQRKAEKEISVAKATLANLMGLETLDYSVETNLKVLPDVPDQETVREALRYTPMSVMSELSVLRENFAVDLARANSIPDPTVGLGIRRFAEDDGTAFLASVSIPLTIFDRNQGRVAEAKANLLAAEAEQESAQLNLTKQAMETWQTLAGDKEEVSSYQNSLLPSAQKSYAQAKKGFDRGAFSFLDLLDAQRTLFDVQEGYLEALLSFHKNKAQIDMLTGVYAELANKTIQPNTDEKE